MNLLVFRLDASRYGIDLRYVERIVQAVEITSLPDAPTVVEGVIDVHGSVRPVFDVRRGFGLVPRDVYVDDHYILATAAGRTVVLHVDEVVGVIEVQAGDLQPVPAVDETSTRIAGLARLDDGLVVIHELDAFLSHAQAAALDAALAGRDEEARA